MSGKYYATINNKMSDLVNCAKTPTENMDTDIFFVMSDYGFIGETTNFVKANSLPELKGWGKPDTDLQSRYPDIPFARPDSCPLPIVYTSGIYSFPVEAQIFNSGTIYLKYNSEKSICEYSTDGGSVYNNLPRSSTGIFIALQGGGGGGGGGCFFNYGVSAFCRGGGGGGGGAFIFAYLDLFALKDTGIPVIINVGSGGAGGEGKGAVTSGNAGNSGSNGGDTTLKYDNDDSPYLTAGGGAGGISENNSSSGSNIGGEGGTASDSNLESAPWLSVIKTFDGKQGGPGGETTQYVFGAPTGPNEGSPGDSYNLNSTSDSITIPGLRANYQGKSDYNKIYVSRRSTSSFFGLAIHGKGSAAAIGPQWGSYSSGGGGAGASVMSYREDTTAVNEKDPSLYGYGGGGAGGWTDTGSAGWGSNGDSGALYILNP